MKLNKTTLIAALALGSLLTMGTAVNAQTATNAPATAAPAGTPPARRMGSPIELYTRLLSLTDDQKPKVQAILDDQRKQLSDLRKDTSLSTQDRHAKLIALHDGVTAKMKEILTAEQFAKYQKMPQAGRRPVATPPAAAPAADAPTTPATPATPAAN